MTLDSDVDTAVSVDYGTVNASGTVADGDYNPSTGTNLLFAGVAGESQTIEVTVFGDQKVELDEMFEVALTSLAASGRAVSVSGPGVGTIRNDDSATLSINDVVLTETDLGATAATFTVTLDAVIDTASER